MQGQEQVASVTIHLQPMGAMTREMHIDACCKTDVGLVRSRNEDTCVSQTDTHCFAVADGMGGKAGGDIASSLFRTAVLKIWGDTPAADLAEGRRRIDSCFAGANREIFTRAQADPDLAGMGCTAELLCLVDGQFLLGHVGDSRVYRLQQGKLQQLTTDHSLVEQQVSQGLITRQQAVESKLRNVILQAVGTGEEVNVDFHQGRLLPGDLFLLCTDGLHSMISDQEIAAVLQFSAPLDVKADLLIDLAKEAGGKDNIGITLVEILP